MTATVQRTVNCAMCNGNNRRTVYEYPANRYDHNNYLTPSWDGGMEVSLTIVKCKNCGFVYQNPIFRDDHLFLLYPESMIPEKLTSANFFQDFSVIWNLSKPYLPANNNKPFAVDIGSRYGALPKFLNEKGLQSVGIEMNAACVNAAKNYGFTNIHCGKIDSLPSLIDHYNKTSVDLITLIDVIEHLTEPNKDFELLSSIQEKGQVLVLVTMFTDSIGGFFFGKEWYYIHGQHTLYFSRKTVKEFLEKHGYEVVKTDIIPLYKSFLHFPKEFLKFLRHKWHLITKTKYKQKKWFADDRPHCLDLMTVVAIKK